jgi:diguanylate cyclase (GGDEF)-like protein
MIRGTRHPAPAARSAPEVEGPVTDLASPADQGALLAAASTTLARGDVDDGLRDLLSGVATATGAGLAALFVREPDNDALQLVIATGVAAEAAAAVMAAVAAGTDHPVAVAARERRTASGPVGQRADGAALTGVACPLMVSRAGVDLVLGVLCVGWEGERPIGDSTHGLLATSAGLAALALDRARLVSMVEERGEWLARVAATDALTGLASRRTLDRVLELEIARADRLKTDVSVVVLDIDGFRAINTEAGTAAGDEILRVVAAGVAEQVRLVDTVARIGGDEFAVVAPGSGGVAVARRVVEAVEAVGPVGGRPVTVSAGIARFPADGTSADDLLAAALSALEAARSSGAGAIAEVRTR